MICIYGKSFCDLILSSLTEARLVEKCCCARISGVQGQLEFQARYSRFTAVLEEFHKQVLVACMDHICNSLRILTKTLS